ncbi:hypothetical protein HYPSUDRAFT_203391 [Hypholoma sublateritium FD-334 SS-4]|uniref:Cytochrome P450 n=1 Tax=Hypholoma sublateritium (strain FD-334 SS-4) TaxID=945553 RepID=A0A0D2NWX8_HYPSF|nr:hypothetical protein HYPSUDRAFT_203391 [Hypholoma sublateritium FD-334 SS-4]
MFDSILALFLSIPVLIVFVYTSRRRDLDHIPTVGYSDPFLSWLSAIRYIHNAPAIISEGYALYPKGAFKIAMIDGWNVILNGNQYISDLNGADPSILSSVMALADMFQFEATLGDKITKHSHIITVIRTSLTRNINARFHDITEEVVRSFDAGIPCEGEAWTSVPAYQLAADVICRVTSRYLFDEPLCNDPNIRVICEQATGEIFKGRFVRYLPESSKPFVARLITKVHGLHAGMMQCIGPIIENRLERRQLNGADCTEEEPNDIITWLIDGAINAGQSPTVADISTRVLLISFTSIHTTSAVFTTILYQLCMNPQDVATLRDEVQRVVQAENWTRLAVTKMHNLDSYLRESQRLHTIANLSVVRMPLEEYTFSDGLVVPGGIILSINTFSRHRSADHYLSPDTFDGFRYAREGGQGQSLATGPSMEYHSFGHGRSACPGRFFATAEIKLMLAHLIAHYDFKMEYDVYPEKIIFEGNALPNREAKVLFRRRV